TDCMIDLSEVDLALQTFDAAEPLRSGASPVARRRSEFKADPEIGALPGPEPGPRQGCSPAEWRLSVCGRGAQISCYSAGQQWRGSTYQVMPAEVLRSGSAEVEQQLAGVAATLVSQPHLF